MQFDDTHASKIQSEMDRFRLFLDTRYDPDFKLGETSPDDIVAYLICKERKGMTQIHGHSCVRSGTAKRGSRINKECDTTVCEIRSAHTSVQTNISILKGGFQRYGLVAPWSHLSQTGNPADSHTVSDHLKALQKEQAKAAFEATQALPIPEEQFFQVVRSASRAYNGNPWDWLIQQQAIFMYLLCYYLARRPNDLGVLKSNAFEWTPDKRSVVISMHDGKTNAGRRVDRVVISPNPNALFCLIAQAMRYRDATRLAGLDLSASNFFVFFMIDRRLNPPRADLTHSTPVGVWNDRFRSLVKEMGISASLSLYGCRVMSALVAKWDDAEWRRVQNAGGWDSAASAMLYSRYSLLAAAVLNPHCPQLEVQAWLAARGEWGIFL